MLRKQKDSAEQGTLFIKEYVNKKTGKLMRASDYGHKAWPIRRKSK